MIRNRQGVAKIDYYKVLGIDRRGTPPLGVGLPEQDRNTPPTASGEVPSNL